MSQTLTVMCGLPAAGKTRHVLAYTHALVLTCDAIRTHGADPTSEFMRLYGRIAQGLDQGFDVVADVCALRGSERTRLRHIGRRKGVRCELVMVCTPTSVCKARDAGRTKPAVGTETKWQMLAKQAHDSMHVVEAEGWDSVTYVPTKEMAFAYK